MPKLNFKKKTNLKSRQYKTKKITKNKEKVGGAYVEDYESLRKKFENFSRVELINYIGENTKAFNDAIEENEKLKSDNFNLSQYNDELNQIIEKFNEQNTNLIEQIKKKEKSVDDLNKEIDKIRSEILHLEFENKKQ